MSAAKVALAIYGSLVLAFLVLPTLIVVPMSFSGSTFLEFPPHTLSLRWYQNFLLSREWQRSAMDSLRVGVLSTLLATLIGTAAAYGLAQIGRRSAAMARGLLLLPQVVPIILFAIGSFRMYATLGMNDTLSGIVIAHAVLGLPFVVILVGAALSDFDFDLELAARSLGVGRIRAFFTVVLPAIRPSVITGALFAFLTSFDEVVVATLIAGGDINTLARRMFSDLRTQLDPTIAAISTCTLLLTTILLFTAQRLQRRQP